MLIIRGVNVFPSQIEYVIMGFPELEAQYQIIVERPDALDVFTIKAELTETSTKMSQKELEKLALGIRHKVNNVTGISPRVELVKPGELPRSVGKAKRVLDMRSGKI
jgi:phenylacetate-CoA ligase